MGNKKVKPCFGKYGERDYPCEVMCRDNNRCRDCYWEWWLYNRRKNLIDWIRNFMIKYKFRFFKKNER